MDEATFDNVAGRLRKANQLITELDPAIRAEAFSILLPWVAGEMLDKARSRTKQKKATQGSRRRQPTKTKRGTKAAPPAIDATGAEGFVRAQDISKPDLAVKAISAWWFSEFGNAPITNAEFRAIADEIGVDLDPVAVDISGRCFV